MIEDVSKYLEAARHATKLGGAELLVRFETGVREQHKNDHHDIGSLVSEADHASDKAILDYLKAEFPDHGFQSEESGNDGMTSPFLWSIDPLDGTSNFLRNIPIFGVSVALLYKNKPVVGVLHFPKLGYTLYASVGKGAWRDGEQIHASQRPVNEALYWAGGKYKGASQLHEEIFDAVGFVKIMSCSSYELATIASGDAEIYYLNNCLHDVAAGVVIISEAGGKITDEAGEPWTPSSKMIVATNGAVHDDVIQLVRKES
ncbi:MAG: inositol monophosphatase [Candidatus Uhrbacteria bacterium]|nr:inositol monophosphatase [Candidatus Uhrbacteria bacterium]